MNFAVLEYNSKSGKVWHHSAKRPNYLADPRREIDPTSFGCYVSALQGEHIPLTGLITGPVNDVSTLTQLGRRIRKRLTNSWPQKYSLEYLKKFDTLMAVHQLSDTHEMIAALKRLKSQPSAINQIIIGVPTQPYGILRAQVEANPRTLRELVQFIRTCDVFISVVKSTVDWYRNISDQEVIYLPQPYPAHFASRQKLPLAQKGPQIFVAGITQRHNIKQGHTIAAALQQKFPSYTIVVPKVAEYEYDYSKLSGTKYQVLPFEPWQQHLPTLAKTTLVINTDYTQTRGRVQTDCAAVGTVSLGGNSDAQVDLFPDLVSQPDTPTEQLIEAGARLLSDTAYYDAVAEKASSRLQLYDYAPSAERLRTLVDKTRDFIDRNKES